MSTKKLEKNENGKSALSIININQIGKSLIRVLVITMLICTALKHGQFDVSGTANFFFSLFHLNTDPYSVVIMCQMSC